ncbi:TetR/AcrR family transcriptional regulator [Phaeacidiphilus oryzae]|uniref:TetR/AcrR family transcriptional regulator n=1 Tax=Phaeacidiphilus oryzae TaxID=348818 RepID=UPI00055EF58D|nr:TetR family transcriptional regulator [Phaeacidiphilus oryzae]
MSPTGAAKAARRDPEGRKRAIVVAACELIAEVGVGRVTHRLVAARAGVPLGATTYYFRSLDELVEAALRHAAELSEAVLGEWLAAVETAEPAELPAVLARLTAEYVRDPERVTLDTELYVGAAHEERLRPLAREWVDGLVAALTPAAGAPAARAVAAYLDGVVLHAFILGRHVDVPETHAALAALLLRRRRD